jgi:hypothetical protein
MSVSDGETAKMSDAGADSQADSMSVTAPSTAAMSEVPEFASVDNNAALRHVQNQLVKGMDMMCKTFGGPAQYLAHEVPSVDAHVDFLEHMRTAYPESDQHYYTSCAQLPAVSNDDLGTTPALCCHVGVLGFDKSCSMKPPPGHARTMGLVEQIVVDGFCTSAEPLLVVQSRDEADIVKVPAPWGSSDRDQEPIVPFSVGYMKGMLRAAVMLGIVHWCWKNNVDLATQHPMLAKSVTTIFVHHSQQSSRIEECLQNMKQSSRGSLRRMTNIIEIVFMVKGLVSFGLNDFASFVRRWNAMSARSHLISGKRAVALKMLFDVAPKACAT